MYFIELIAKKFLSKKEEKEKDEPIPDFEQEEIVQEDCDEHVFLPVDSTGEILACINCGLVVHKKDLHKTNPF